MCDSNSSTLPHTIVVTLLGDSAVRSIQDHSTLLRPASKPAQPTQLVLTLTACASPALSALEGAYDLLPGVPVSLNVSAGDSCTFVIKPADAHQ